MPIRPEMRDRYPSDWKLRSRFVREVRAKNCCEWCGVRHGALGGRDRAGNWYPALPLGEKLYGLEWPRPGGRSWCDGYTVEPLRIIRIVLTAAHVHDDRPDASSLLNLAALCQRCHNRHDAKMRAAGIRERRRLASGQVEMAL